MGNPRINWHTEQTVSYKKDAVLTTFSNYLMREGFHNDTIKLYVGRLNAFLDYAKSDLPDLTVADAYRNDLIERRLSRSHINNTGFAIKKFYAMNGLDWPFKILKPNEGLPFYFDEDDISTIFAACTNIKHLAMLQTSFFGCLRSSELCRLDDSDLDIRAKTIRLRETKNGSDAIALINDTCVNTLKTYLKIRPKIKIGNRIPLFYTDYGKCWDKNDVYRMFLYYKNRAGIKKPGGVHVFSRHSAATIMIAKGCDIRIVKDLLRHKDMRTTLRYAHVSDKTKRERYEQCLIL